MLLPRSDYLAWLVGRHGNANALATADAATLVEKCARLWRQCPTWLRSRISPRSGKHSRHRSSWRSNKRTCSPCAPFYLKEPQRRNQNRIGRLEASVTQSRGGATGSRHPGPDEMAELCAKSATAISSPCSCLPATALPAYACNRWYSQVHHPLPKLASAGNTRPHKTRAANPIATRHKREPANRPIPSSSID